MIYWFKRKSFPQNLLQSIDKTFFQTNLEKSYQIYYVMGGDWSLHGLWNKRDLNLDSYLPYLIIIYTCEVIIVPRVYGGKMKEFIITYRC